MDHWTLIKEGETFLYVPTASLERTPSKLPAFYNPKATLNRTISISVYRAFEREHGGPIKMADALAGVGARGVRVANEAPEIETVHMNDLNPVSMKFALASAAENNVSHKCTSNSEDVCLFLARSSSPDSRFSIVDLDPFGSPSPYVDCCLRAVSNGGIVSLTATDTAVLCGLHPRVAQRKYYGRGLRVEYSKEIALRLLFAILAETAMRLNMGIHPSFSHVEERYARVYATVSHGAGEAAFMLGKLGYISHCYHCFHREGNLNVIKECPECRATLSHAGPLWLGSLREQSIVNRICTNLNFCKDLHARKIFSTNLEELNDAVGYYVTDRISDKLGIPPPKLESVVKWLKKEGYSASRTALHPRGFRTDAPAKVAVESIRFSLT